MHGKNKDQNKDMYDDILHNSMNMFGIGSFFPNLSQQDSCHRY